MYEEQIRESWSRNFFAETISSEQEEAQVKVDPYRTEYRRIKPPPVDECAGCEFL